MEKTTCLKAKYVIGFENDEHVVYENGQVVFRGDTILYCGNDYDGQADETIDLGLSIISPGFIDLDSDIDTDHSLIDVAFPKSGKDEDRFQINRAVRRGDPYTDEDYLTRQKYSIAQLIKNGITTAMPIEGELFHGFSQSYREHELLAQASIEMGMRMYVGPSFKSATDRKLYIDVDKEREKQSFEDAIKFFDKFNGIEGDLIRSFVNPCQLAITRKEILLDAFEFAKCKNAPYRLHACEGVHEWEYTKHHFGMTTIDWFESIGLLGDNLLIPHCVTAKNSELKKLAQNGVSVIHTPFAEAHVGSALLSFGKYAAYGINMTMGTDAQPNDMIRNMRFAWDLDRLCFRKRMFFRYHEDGTTEQLLSYEPDYPRTTAKTFFDAATINGAVALRRDDIGKLCKGAKADIISVDLNDIQVGPYQDILRTLIVSCTGANVTNTIINGKFVMRDKHLIGIDEEKLLAEGQKVYNKFLSLYEEYDAKGRSFQSFFPDSLKLIKKD